MTSNQAMGIMCKAGGFKASPLPYSDMLYIFSFSTGRRYTKGMTLQPRVSMARKIHSNLKTVNKGLIQRVFIDEVMDLDSIIPRLVAGMNIRTINDAFSKNLISSVKLAKNKTVSARDIYIHLLAHDYLEFFPLNKIEFDDIETKMIFSKCVRKLKEIGFQKGLEYLEMPLGQIYYELTGEVSYSFTGPTTPIEPTTLAGKAKLISNKLMGRYLNTSVVSEMSAFDRLKESIEKIYNRRLQ